MSEGLPGTPAQEEEDDHEDQHFDDLLPLPAHIPHVVSGRPGLAGLHPAGLLLLLDLQTEILHCEMHQLRRGESRYHQINIKGYGRVPASAKQTTRLHHFLCF